MYPDLSMHLNASVRCCLSDGSAEMYNVEYCQQVGEAGEPQKVVWARYLVVEEGYSVLHSTFDDKLHDIRG